MSAPDDLGYLRGQVSDTLVNGLLDPVGGADAAAQSPDVQSLTPSEGDAPVETALNAAQRFLVRNGMKLNGADKALDSTFNRMTGNRFTDRERRELEDRALNNADWDKDQPLATLQPGDPLLVDMRQKSSLDRLVRQSGSDRLGEEARQAYDEAWRNGRIRLRNK